MPIRMNQQPHTRQALRCEQVPANPMPAPLTAAQHLPELGAAQLLHVQPLLLRHVRSDVAARGREEDGMCH